MMWVRELPIAVKALAATVAAAGVIATAALNAVPYMSLPHRMEQVEARLNAVESLSAENTQMTTEVLGVVRQLRCLVQLQLEAEGRDLSPLQVDAACPR